MLFRAFFAFAALWLAPMAFAGSVEDARSLFMQGEYDAAIDMATALETPEGLMIAAETLSAKVMLNYVDDANDSAKQARKWAEEAFEQRPDSQEAAVQFALAYGFETRTSSPFRAWRKKLPNKTLKAIEDVRTRYPDDPRGDALLGAWHLGIVRKAGAKNGAKWYDAHEERGINYYEAALAAAPGDIVIASNYVVTILALDIDKHYDRGIEILQILPAMTAKNAVERDVLSRMEKLSLIAEDKELLSKTVIELVDGKQDD